MDYFRQFGRRIKQVQHLPERRPRTWRRPATTLEEHAVGSAEAGPGGLGGRMDHRELMFIVGVVVALLALGLLLALTALLLGWF